jgi:hypothetical protein
MSAWKGHDWNAMDRFHKKGMPWIRSERRNRLCAAGPKRRRVSGECSVLFGLLVSLSPHADFHNFAVRKKQYRTRIPPDLVAYFIVVVG